MLMADGSGLSTGSNNPLNALSSIGLGDLNTTLKISNQNFSQFLQILQQIFPRTVGTFTFAAAATTTVTQTAIASNSYVVLIPTNAAAATLIGSTKSPYVSTKTAGTSFVVSTASGVAAAGTETFQYVIINPV